MEAALTVRTPRHIALKEWDEEFARLVKETVLKPRDREATDAELALFAEQAQRTGLDPMTRQIYGVFRKSRGKEQMTIQVGIDGLRTIAERTGQYVGQDGPFWCDTDGQWREVWIEQKPPVASKVIVKKVIGGVIAETPAVAHFAEYVPMYDGKPQGLWNEKPALMLAKCAEALALRKAFPNDMSGLYTDDEMSRADVSPAVIDQTATVRVVDHATGEVVESVPFSADPFSPGREKAKWMLAAAVSKKADLNPETEKQRIEDAESWDRLSELYALYCEALREAGGDPDLVAQRFKERSK